MPDDHHAGDLATEAVVAGAEDDTESDVEADVPVASGERV
jgi:hypothetical protein